MALSVQLAVNFPEHFMDRTVCTGRFVIESLKIDFGSTLAHLARQSNSLLPVCLIARRFALLIDGNLDDIQFSRRSLTLFAAF
jgi:hypothetical protein